MRKSIYLTAGVTTLPYISSACTKPEQEVSNKIGVQIYSVRNQLTENFEETIMKIGEMGFDQIEAYGLGTDGMFFGNMTAEEVKQIANNAGVTIPSTHSSYFTADEAPAIIEAAKILETNYVVIPWLSEEMRADYQVHAENFNEIGRLLNEEGIGFAYHNHDFEFYEMDGGNIPMEVLIEYTDPEYVKFQADLYWIQKAGFDPLEFLQKHSGRFCSYHIKDANVELEQTTVGAGIIDFETILAKNEEFGIEFVFIEDERMDDPLANIKAGHDYLRGITY